MSATSTSIEQLQQKGAAAVAPSNKSKVLALIEANKAKLTAAMPKHLNADRLLRVMTTAISANPKLLECTTSSLLGSFMTLGQLGLEPNTPLGHAYLIPYRNKRADRVECQVQIGYKGLIDLARRSGHVVSIAAHVVYANDLFDFEYGLDEKLRHKPLLDGDRGEPVAVYAVAHMTDGGHAFEVRSWGEMVRRRQKSQQAKANDVYDEHPEEMFRKNLVRALAKYLPLSIEASGAVRLEELREDGKGQNVESALEGEWTPTEDVTPAPKDDHPAQQTTAGHVGLAIANDPAQPLPTQVNKHTGEILMEAGMRTTAAPRAVVSELE